MRTRGCAWVWWLTALTGCPWGAPEARLRVPAQVMTGQAFTADGRESAAGWQPIERYRWDFGDGTPALITASAVQPHRYSAPGSYVVQLSVADGAGRRGQDQAGVEVADHLEPPVELEPPRIAVDACRTRGILDCLVDFGSSVLDQETVRRVTVRNTGEAPLQVDAVQLDATSAPGFRLLEGGPTVVRGGGSVVVSLAFRPQWDATHVGLLRVRSNADNLEDGQDAVLVPLRAVATQLPAPRLVVEPEECAFGDLLPGTTGECSLVLRNEGTAALSLDGVALTADTARVFGLRDPGMLPASLAPAEERAVTLTFAPELDGVYSGALAVRSNDPERPILEVPAWGTANTPLPVAVARVARVNGQPVGGGTGMAVRPLDDVVVSGADSRPSTAEARVVSYHWTLVETPGTSTVRLTSPDTVETGFSFNSNGVDRRGLDVVGTFSVQLLVADSLGRRSINVAKVSLDTIPADALHVQLTWEDPNADIDLHLIRGENPPFSQTDDCYYANCVAQSESSVRWGGPETSPHLDVDDVDGFGPENTGIFSPAPGRYVLALHFYDPHGENQDVPVRLRVYVHGVLQGDFQTHLVCCNAFWVAAVVDWSATPLVTSVNAFSQVFYGSCTMEPPPGLRCTF